jgi:membrane protein YdbS with pleckstrin-like domain
MKPTLRQVFQVHKSWLVPTTLVLVITVVVDGVTVWFSQRPLLWSTLIASSLPISMAIFVIIPMLRKSKADSVKPR